MAAELAVPVLREPTVSGAIFAEGTVEPWRQSVLRGMLTVTAVVAPLLAALGIFVGATRRDPKDLAVMVAAGTLLPALRFLPGVCVRRRALAAILTLFATGIFLLGRAGFAAGLSVVIVTTCVLGVVTLGRSLGFAMIGLSAAAHLVIGLLVARGVLHLAPREVDPMLMRNWIRMATSTSLLAVLLASVIDFVIRHVEANARAATRMLGELQVAYARLGQLHGRLEAAKEEERRFLAHELHDELGQSLTALKLRLQLGGQVPAPPANDTTPPALALIDQLIARVRRISVDLRPPLLDEVGLGPALRLYLEGQAELSKVPIELDVQPPDGIRLAPDLEIACFRVVQESITNALRHAAARRIQVRLVRDPARVSLAIRDDGRGFDTAALAGIDLAGHLGIVGMRERVRARSGAFRLTSRPGAGTSVEIELPI
ncbi:MAG TPA: sensor histidine kinase [Polyangia bacterium]|jgi:signal transduction histidine kinase|nr:sensor histidine kinase [Polyangia bacterium]